MDMSKVNRALKPRKVREVPPYKSLWETESKRVDELTREGLGLIKENEALKQALADCGREESKLRARVLELESKDDQGLRKKIEQQASTIKALLNELAERGNE